MAYVNPRNGGGDRASALRKDAGAYLRSLRTKAELTQAQTAKALGYDWPSQYAAHEQGVVHLSPEHYLDFAMAVGVDPKTLVKALLRWQNPDAWAILWSTETVKQLHPVKSQGNIPIAPNREAKTTRDRLVHANRKSTKSA